MLDKSASLVPDAALTGSMRDFRMPSGANLLARTHDFFSWQDQRRVHGLWPFSRALDTGPRTECDATDDSGHAMTGVNFASQDYLSLSSHPAIKDAAIEAVHSVRRAQRRLPGPGRQHQRVGRARAEHRRIPRHGGGRPLSRRAGRAGFGVIKGLVRAERPHRHGRPVPRLPAGRRQCGDPEHLDLPASRCRALPAPG